MARTLTPEQQFKALKEQFRRHQVNPLEWVKTVFGDNIKKAQLARGIEITTDTGLTRQQEEALTMWGKLIESKRNLREGKPNTGVLLEYEKKMGMSIQSSNGNGKDFMAALITWHFNDCFSKPRIMATANTGQQLRMVYWSEVAKVKSLAIKPDGGLSHLHSEFVIQADKMFRKLPKDKGDEGKEWLTELVTINAKSTPEEQGESLAGRHAKNMLIVVDEASGIPDAVFKPLDRTLTDYLNLVFMIFNPTRNTGYAIESQTKHREQWIALHWTALDSENVTSEQIERLRKYGEDSPAYRIGVLGLPPVSTENALIPYEWITEAINRDIEPTPYDPVILGCDVGGGGDRSVIAIRQGGKITDIRTFNDKDTMKVVGWISETAHGNEASVSVVDSNGLGAGVADRLRELEHVVHPVWGQGKADREGFLNTRAEMYFTLREQFENKAISIPDNQDLVNELSAMKFEQSGNQIKILGKKDIRKAIGMSPDLADALAYTYAVPDVIYRRGGNHHTPLPRRRYGIV